MTVFSVFLSMKAVQNFVILAGGACTSSLIPLPSLVPDTKRMPSPQIEILGHLLTAPGTWHCSEDGYEFGPQFLVLKLFFQVT